MSGARRCTNSALDGDCRSAHGPSAVQLLFDCQQRGASAVRTSHRAGRSPAPRSAPAAALRAKVKAHASTGAGLLGRVERTLGVVPGAGTPGLGGSGRSLRPLGALGDCLCGGGTPSKARGRHRGQSGPAPTARVTSASAASATPSGFDLMRDSSARPPSTSHFAPIQDIAQRTCAKLGHGCRQNAASRDRCSGAGHDSRIVVF
jgi:hypothetical protein